MKSDTWDYLCKKMRMNYWLIKSEPSVYPWAQLCKEKKTSWDGVRNYAARNNLKAMKKGDLLLYYHSNEGLEIVGIATVSKTHYQDPTSENEAWVSVEVKPVKPLSKPVTLSEIKKEPALADMQLIRLSRLSVSAVQPDEFMRILAMGNTEI